MSKSYDELMKNHNAIISENKSLKQSQKKSNDDILILQKEVEELRYEINKRNQDLLKKTVVLSNV